MSKVKVERDGNVAIIIMSDPATLNAIDVEMSEALKAAFMQAGEEARCVLLTGEGRAFSSGANLNAPRTNLDEQGRIDVGARLESHFNPLVTQLRDLPIPWISAVNGVAAGIGCSFALLADLIIAGESAYFLQAFRRIGLVPDGSATYHLPRMITRARAMEMMLLGEKLPAAKALEWGLINRCVPDGELMGAARALAHELADGPTKTLGLIRKLGWASQDALWGEQLQAEREAQRSAGHTEDFREGVAAFLQKRKAEFKGT